MNRKLFRILFLLLCPMIGGNAGPVYEISGSRLLNYSWQNSESAFAVPEGVESIDAGCFADQWKNPVLKKLLLPASLKQLPEAFWQGCLESLEAIEVAPENSCFRSQNGVLFSADGKSLLCYPPRRPQSHYSVPDPVEQLAPWAFRDNPFLQAVNLPVNLKRIGAGAFYDCRNLRSMTIPAEVSQIGTDAFRRWRDDNPYQLFYDSQLFLENPSNPYGPAADAAGTAVFLPGPLPAAHYHTQFQQGMRYSFLLRPGWNFYYIPENHPVFLQKKIFSYLRSSFNQIKRCYITHSGATGKTGLFWFFSPEEKPVEFTGTTGDYLRISEPDNALPGWQTMTYRQLQNSPRKQMQFHYWNASEQKFRTGDSRTALPPETVVWLPLAK